MVSLLLSLIMDGKVVARLVPLEDIRQDLKRSNRPRDHKTPPADGLSALEHLAAPVHDVKGEQAGLVRSAYGGKDLWRVVEAEDGVCACLVVLGALHSAVHDRPVGAQVQEGHGAERKGPLGVERAQENVKHRV